MIARLRLPNLLPIAVALALLCASAPQAKAMSFGDAVETVGVSSGVGLILGASTLPFYGSPGDHKNNMLYGAAIGAVAGVFIASAAALKEGSANETKIDLPMDKTIFAKSSAERDLAANPPAIWQPVVNVLF